MEVFSSRMSDVYGCDQQILLSHLHLVGTVTAEQECLPFDSSCELLFGGIKGKKRLIGGLLIQ